MARDEAPAQRAEKKRSGLVGTLLKLPFTLMWIVFLSIICSVLIEWIGIYFDWFSQAGSDHAHQTMLSEMGYLDSQFSQSLLVSSPVESSMGQDALSGGRWWSALELLAPRTIRPAGAN